MANQLTVGSVIDKNKITSDVAWVILLDISLVDPNTRQVVEVMRIVRNDENVVYGVDGQSNPITYIAGNFEVKVEQAKGQTPRVSVAAQDQQGLIQSRMEAYAGGVFSEVRMTVVNTDMLDKPPELQETFQVTRSSVKDYVVSFDLGSENRLAVQFPKHRQWQDRCTWRFKGYGCGYVGANATCDYSKDGPDGCADKDNTVNFRALPGLVRMNI